MGIGGLLLGIGEAGIVGSPRKNLCKERFIVVIKNPAKVGSVTVAQIWGSR